MIDNSLIANISNTKRFSSDFLFQEENIATHSLEMSLLCINFSKLVKESDRNLMCYKCTIHDLEEVNSGDVRRPFKHANPELRDLINQTAEKMLKYSVDEETLNDWRNAKDDTEINGYLVGLADRMQCYIKMSREVKHYGNSSLSVDLEEYSSVIEYWLIDISNSELMCAESKTNLIDYISSLLTIY